MERIHGRSTGRRAVAYIVPTVLVLTTDQYVFFNVAKRQTAAERKANSLDPGQTAPYAAVKTVPLAAVWPVSTLCAQSNLSLY